MNRTKLTATILVSVFVFCILAESLSVGNGGPFVIKYPNGDPAVKDGDRELRKTAAWALEQVKPATQPQLEQRVWEQIVAMASETDLIVVAIKEQHIDNRFEIKQILKGSGHVTFEQLEKINGMDIPPADETKQWIMFLRVEREHGRRLYPLIPTGWFVPYSKGLAQKIVEAIPLPIRWGPAEGGLRMGLRVRKSHVALGEDIPVEIHIQNISQKNITLYQHLMPVYGYHPYTSFEVVTPDEKRWKLAEPVGSMSEYDFTPALELSPGETYIHLVRLNKWAVEREPLKPGEEFNLFIPGTYKITCTYSVEPKPDYIHPWNPPKNAWSGTLTSSPVELRVIAAKGVIAATQPLSGSVVTETIKYLQIDGRKREVNWMLHVITSDEPSSKMYHKSKWLLRRGDQANEEHIALIIAGMGTVYDIKASPSGHYLAILSIGEGAQMLEVVDLPLLLMEKKYKVLRTIDPFPGGVAIERWDGDKLVITSGALLTYIGEDGRVPHPSLGWMSPQKYALSVESGGIEALSEGAKNPVEYFIRKLSSSHPWERQDAAMALKELKAKSAIGALKKAVAVESYPGGRAFMQEIVDELEKLPKGGEKPAAVLRWVDDETGQMLFTVRDIVRFDWEQQIFELSRRRAMDLLANQYGLSRPFRVYDSSGVIYRGTFVSSLASMTFDGPVIVVGSIIKNIQPPLYRIDGGYPQGPERDEIRFSERMKMALADAGVFCEIDLTKPPAPFTSIMSEWAGEKERPRVLVELFPETFQIGEMTRIHVHFVGGKHLSEDAHAIEVNATVKANNGEFEYTVQRIFPIGRDGWKKAYVLESMPWGPVLASPDAYAKPGPAEVSVQVSTKRTIYTKTGSYSDLINTIKTKPIEVTILPQDRDVQPTERPSASVVPDLQRERDILLAEADAAIRDGIVELAEKFPQLKRAKSWGLISVRSEPGRIGIYFYRTDPGSKPGVRKREDYIVTVDIRPIPSDVQEFQLGMDPIYPNLGLVGLVGAGAGDAELDAALNKLIDKALAPLRRLAAPKAQFGSLLRNREEISLTI